MKLPNFRLYNIQATTSLIFAVLGFGFLLVQVVFTFKGLDSEYWRIPYNAAGGWGAMRRPIVYGCTAICFVLGAAAGVVGFRSLGQKRNDRQSHSWAGTLLGPVVLAIALVVFFAWRTLSEPAIMEQAG